MRTDSLDSFKESCSPANSQDLLFSQGSTYSVSSEAGEERRLNIFHELVSFIGKLDPELTSSFSSPLDLQVQATTLKR